MPEATGLSFTKFSADGDAVGGDADDFVVLPDENRKVLGFVFDHDFAYGGFPWLFRPFLRISRA